MYESENENNISMSLNCVNALTSPLLFLFIYLSVSRVSRMAILWQREYLKLFSLVIAFTFQESTDILPGSNCSPPQDFRKDKAAVVGS